MANENPLPTGAAPFNPVTSSPRPLPPRPLTSARPRVKAVAPSKLDRLKHGATPFLIGAAIGGVLMVVLKGARKPPQYALFAAPKPSLTGKVAGKVAKVALMAAGRALLQRVATRAVVRTAARAT